MYNGKMIVCFSSLENQKKNQAGYASDRPGHVYSNPNSPYLCSVLDLDKYLLTHPDLLQEGSPLFPGDSQYERFLK